MARAPRSLQRSLLIGALFLAWAMPGSNLCPAQDAGADADFYAPVEGDFRPEYDRDQVNQRAQSWEQYWGWIKAFYAGNFASQGWTRQGKETIAGVKSKVVKLELTKTLNELGKEIAKEWAKDNAIRKISTADLQRWGATLRTARLRDNGSGRTLKTTLQAIQKEVTKKMGQ